MEMQSIQTACFLFVLFSLQLSEAGASMIGVVQCKSIVSTETRNFLAENNQNIL